MYRRAEPRFLEQHFYQAREVRNNSITATGRWNSVEPCGLPGLNNSDDHSAPKDALLSHLRLGCSLGCWMGLLVRGLLAEVHPPLPHMHSCPFTPSNQTPLPSFFSLGPKLRVPSLKRSLRQLLLAQVAGGRPPLAQPVRLRALPTRSRLLRPRATRAGVRRRPQLPPGRRGRPRCQTRHPSRGVWSNHSSQATRQPIRWRS